MDYFEVTLANGNVVIANGAPQSYLESCLTNTGATFKRTNEKRAKEINLYYGYEESGWSLLHNHALEAKVEKLSLKKINELTDPKLIELFNKYKVSLKDEWYKEESGDLYYDVILANGKYIMAYNAPGSYVEGCLTNTGARLRKSTKERAEMLNNYCDVNTSEGQLSLRERALDAKDEIQNGLVLISVYHNEKFKAMFPDNQEFLQVAQAIEQVCSTSQLFDDLLLAYKELFTTPENIKENLKEFVQYINEQNKKIESKNQDNNEDSFFTKIKRKFF